MCPTPHWMSIWHWHGHTCRNTCTHIVAYTGSAQSDHSSTMRGLDDFFCFVAHGCLSVAPFFSLLFIFQAPETACRFQYLTLKLIKWEYFLAGFDRGQATVITVLWGNCCVTFWECSICIAFDIASVLFVICLLTNGSYRLKSEWRATWSGPVIFF